MGRFVPINVTNNLAEKTAPIVTGAKTYYDGKQCWQYKVVFDRPGTYSYTLPANAICARTVLVGGGGKPKCINATDPNSGGTCVSFAGAGGAYSEKTHAVTGGVTAFCIVVGRQEQDSTLACNGSAVHTAGGAAGCVPGAASGGDWNSRGGCAGYVCNYCGGSFSHHCGSCKYLCCATCCGYCIVYQYDPAGSLNTSCCNYLAAGGGSAGSPLALCGGKALNVCGWCSPTGSGGAGIGDWFHDGNVSNCFWSYTCCSCICAVYCDTMVSGYGYTLTYPTSAGGGGGTLPQNKQGCRSWQGQCIAGVWKGGDGGPGGPRAEEGFAWTFEWGYHAQGSYPFGSVYCHQCWCTRCFPYGPTKVCWWDIQDIKGSGSPGTVYTRQDCIDYMGTGSGLRPRNSGEGAGTGAIIMTCCSPDSIGDMMVMTNGSSGPQVNWLKLCQLGCCGHTQQAWLMQDGLFPFFVTCAGTLGGSGGTYLCGYTSKAGAGGGGGQAKCQILCVCWGGNFDLCNGGASCPALAFPPCLLDMMTSNAGMGLAIIYYREA